MSNAPVVASIVAAVFASVPALSLYANSTSKKLSILTSAKSFLKYQIFVLTCAFFLFLLVGTAAGIFVRKSNFFFGSPYRVELNDMIAAGVNVSTAQAILQARLMSGTKLPERPEILFDSISESESLCTKKPARISDNHAEVVELFSRRGGVWREVMDKIGEVSVPITAKGQVEDDELKRATAYGFLEAAWLIGCNKIGAIQ